MDAQRGRAYTGAMPEADWGVYTTTVNDRPATVVVDLGWHDRGPDPERPFWIVVAAPFRTAGEDGLPDGEEARSLEPVGEALIAAMAREAGATNVGQMSAGGYRRWFFYAGSGRVEGAVRKVFDRVSGYEPRVRSQEDPTWRNYREKLYPSPEQMRWINDLRVLLMLGQHGDSGLRPRQVEHWAYFGDRAAAGRFARWCTDNGYALDGDAQPYQSDDGTFGVRFSHIGPATIEAINERTVAADSAARQLGGEYDGWETMLIKRKPWWRFWG